MPYLGQSPSKGDENNFKILDDISSYTLTFDGSDSSVVSAANDTITSLNHRFVQGQRVTYNKGGGSVIAGLSDGVYFIIKHDHHTIKLATSASNATNGIAVNITGVGGGSSHTLNVAFDGVNTKFKATHTNGQKARITRSAQLVISINGVIQQPHDTATPSTGFGFDLDGTIVFSQAPVASDEYWAHVLTNNNVTFDISDNDIDNFTGNGSTVSFNLSKTPPDNRNVLVTIDGVIQYPNDPDGTVRSYTVVENVLTFVTAPASGVEIQVRHIGFAGSTSGSGSGGVTSFYGRTGAVVLKNTDNIVANNAEFAGNLTVQGTMTTLDTKVTEVDQLEVAANNTTVGVAITQSGSGDILNLYDGSTEVFSVTDGGDVGIARSIFHLGDTNTLIGFPENDNVAFRTGGIERVSITGAGVSIKSGNPSLRLQGTSSSFGDTAKIIASRNNDGSLVTGSIVFDPVNAAGADIIFNTRDSNVVGERVRIKNDGKVGIGTDNPTFFTHIQADGISGDVLRLTATASGQMMNIQNKAGSSYPAIVRFVSHDGTGFWDLQYNNTDNSFSFDKNDSEKLNITSGGDVGIARSIFHLGDTNTSIGFPAADTVQFITSGSERLRITSDGKIGIGEDSPEWKLSVYDADYSGVTIKTNRNTSTDNIGGLHFKTRTTNVAYIQSLVDGTIKFRNSSSLTERLRIDSSGKLFLHGNNATGTNNSTTRLPNGYTFNIAGNSSNDGISIVRYNSGYGAYGLNIGRSRSNTVGTNLAVVDGNELGHITFYGANGSSFSYAAQITAIVDGEVGTGGDTTDMPGALSFRTTADGSGGTTPTERLRIDSSGRVLVSGEAALTSTSLSHSLQVATSSDADGIAIIGRAADDIGEISFYEADKTTNLGEIQYRRTETNIRARSAGAEMNFATTTSGGSMGDRLTITADGDFGTNGVTPTTQSGRVFHLHAGNAQQRFHMTNGTTGTSATDGFEILIDQESNTNCRIRNFEAGYMAFDTGGSNNEVMRLTSGGRVGINTTLTEMDGVTGNLNVANTNYNNHTVINLSRNTAADRAFIRFSNPNGNIGSIDTFGSDLIMSSNNDLKFRTKPSGGSMTERLSITSDGIRSSATFVDTSYHANPDPFADGSGLVYYRMNYNFQDSGLYGFHGTGSQGSPNKEFNASPHFSLVNSSGEPCWDNPHEGAINIPNLKNSYPFSMAAWINVSSWPTTGDNDLIMNLSIGNQRISLSICCFNTYVSDGADFYIMYGGKGHHYFRPSSKPTNTWIHVVYSVVGDDDTGHRVYQNGADLTTRGNRGGGHGGSAGWALGGNAANNERFAIGRIGSIRFFNKALSASEASALYTNDKFYT